MTHIFKLGLILAFYFFRNARSWRWPLCITSTVNNLKTVANQMSSHANLYLSRVCWNKMMALISISPLFSISSNMKMPMMPTLSISRNLYWRLWLQGMKIKTCCDYSQLITLTRIQCTVNQLLVLKKEYYVKIEL